MLKKCNKIAHELRCPGYLIGAALILIGAVALSPAQAGIITSPGGSFQVGIDSLGNLYDPIGGIGFRRVSDGYDPIQPRIPREAWGVAAGTKSGYVDPEYVGTLNILPNGSPVFGPNSAFISTYLNAGSGNLLQIDQNYRFAAENVLRITHTIWNVSGSAQHVQYSRNVDWDIYPTEFFETITVPAWPAEIKDASFCGFENPDPLSPFLYSSGPGGGSFGPSDLGGGLLVDFGTLNSGASVTFDIWHAINMTTGQTEDELRAQVAALGGDFLISGASGNVTGPKNSAVLGYTPPAIPEASTLTLLGLGLVGLVGVSRRRK